MGSPGTCPLPPHGRPEDALERIFGGLARVLVLPGVKPFTRVGLRLMRWLPGIGRGFEMADVETEIARLEGGERFAEARALRTTTLERLPAWCLGPLWRSEGEDRLWRLHDYAGALDAFEKAMTAADGSPVTYGVTAPDRVFCGAAVAAVMVGDHVRARRYHAKLADLLAHLRGSPSLAEHVAAYDEVDRWLEQSLGSREPESV